MEEYKVYHNEGNQSSLCGRTISLLYEYRIYRTYSDRQAWANSVDPDETPLKAASHQGLHCLPPIQQF